MRECKKAKQLFSRYLDKETNDFDTAFVKGHLNICNICNREYLEILKVKQLMLEKEHKFLPSDYLVSRLEKEIASQQYAKRMSSWVAGMGNLARRLIPVPVTVIALLLVFLILNPRQELSEYSLEEHLLSGAQTTSDTAVRLMLGASN